jgi:hypothetical protein
VLLIVDLDKHISNAGHGATGSLNSFLIRDPNLPDDGKLVVKIMGTVR